MFKNKKILTLILSLNWTPITANSTYMKRMLDSKTFQVREESSTTTPGGYMSSSNERRDFIIRLRTNLTVRPYVSFFGDSSFGNLTFGFCQKCKSYLNQRNTLTLSGQNHSLYIFCIILPLRVKEATHIVCSLCVLF